MILIVGGEIFFGDAIFCPSVSYPGIDIITNGKSPRKLKHFYACYNLMYKTTGFVPCIQFDATKLNFIQKFPLK